MRKQLRAAVLTLVFSITLVPMAAAAPARDHNPSIGEKLARLVRLIKKFTVSGNADGLTNPRP